MHGGSESQEHGLGHEDWLDVYNEAFDLLLGQVRVFEGLGALDREEALDDGVDVENGLGGVYEAGFGELVHSNNSIKQINDYGKLRLRFKIILYAM